MIKVAVTGNIGSGKTTVCRIFESLGVAVYYADKEAKKLYSNNEVIKKVRDLFGSEVFNKDEKLEHSKLAEVVFSDSELLKQLNQIIHPLVLEDFFAWVNTQGKAKYIVYESALLYESGFNEYFDRSILVSAPTHLAMSRVMKRENTSQQDFEKRSSHQLPEKEKQELADHTIRNDETIALIPQVIELHREFQNM